jgi:hypothetical protein
MRKMLSVLKYPFDLEKVHTGMNYFYFYLYRMMIQKIFDKKKGIK